MLRNMFLGSPPGTYDRILDFSTAVTGTLFYAPCADFFDAPPPSPVLSGTESLSQPASAPAAQAPAPTGAGDGSLHIGSLQESAQ